jgi:hypothetical protein
MIFKIRRGDYPAHHRVSEQRSAFKRRSFWVRNPFGAILVYCHCLHASGSDFRLKGIAQFTRLRHRNEDARCIESDARRFSRWCGRQDGELRLQRLARPGLFRCAPPGVNRSCTSERSLVWICQYRYRLRLVRSTALSGENCSCTLERSRVWRETYF